MVNLVLVLGDQLTHSVAALAAADKTKDIVVMAEVMREAEYVPHHPQKIALILSAMRHFAQSLRDQGWTVAYTHLDDPENTQSIVGELIRRVAEHGADKVIATKPGEWRLVQALNDAPLPVTLLEDTRFLASEAEFQTWAEGRKSLRMEFFYREMRRKHGILLDGDKPVGGKWNYDTDNRKRAAADLFRAKPLRFAPDAITEAVLALVADRFAKNFGNLDSFAFAVTREDALRAQDHFIKHSLADFGATQDAMLVGDVYVNHSLLSPYLNIGLLDPLEVCLAAQAEYHAGRAPLNSVEGFIRQILGWREFVRGIYHLEGPDYVKGNALGQKAPLPWVFWGGKTKMTCMEQAVGQTRDHAYAHHIQRLMITGNFALLAGVDPHQVHEWYLAVYIDAFEWVEAPNTVGMSQYADGGLVGSKPYVSSGSYINKMSDYCQNCAYDVKDGTGENACPFNSLYWSFIDRHADDFIKNPRVAMPVRTWQKMKTEKRAALLQRAENLLSDLEAGKPV